ncbi:excinuclease ABC subunit UvrA [Proteiniclasticum sp. SCR006]|uniref:UvrABC system protein A n=1 Tax=Proteiniclasticum aestuarii TaxID=2817862 RepID=A0A939HAT5_9CLOT|nr:excinuclease ABC subunit UvrA [Proteiniclasticum aestuarii]
MFSLRWIFSGRDRKWNKGGEEVEESNLSSAFIYVSHATEGNLKDISLKIPKNRLVVLTGLSGSGKSTLAVDTIYQECQRQYLEAIGYQGIPKPKVQSIRNLSPAIKITQSEYGRNPRSSVGTVTNIYTELRMIYEKLHERICPSCQKKIRASLCREETEKVEGDFKVYMFCSHCGYRMEKLTRSHFSFNTREGACKACHGLGEVMKIDLERVINEDLSLEEGAVAYWDHAYKDYSIGTVNAAFRHYGLKQSDHRLVKDFSEGERILLLYGAESEEAESFFKGVKVPKKVADGKFEGVLTTLWRRLHEKGGITAQLEPYFRTGPCDKCHGDKLEELPRSALVEGRPITELSGLSLAELLLWVEDIEKNLEMDEKAMVEVYLQDMKTKLKRLIRGGIGYLSLNRQTMTLSAGEAQRMKLAATLDSTLTGIIYIMDEPTVGLHPKDTAGIMKILKELRDLGNTVLVIEHDPEVMKEADHVIDMGPGGGSFGGEVIFEGTYEEILKDPDSVTGTYLSREKRIRSHPRMRLQGFIEVRNADRFNLRSIDVDIPKGCMTSVTGVSGSGKSTLVMEVLAGADAKERAGRNIVKGTDDFDEIITVEQSAVSRMKRSNVATYSGLYSEIRKVFGSLKEAKALDLTAKDFSFNTKGGRCERCEGLGYVTSNMLFFEDVDVVCPECGGKQFNEEVLSVKYKEHSIHEVLQLSVFEAQDLFMEKRNMTKILKLLMDVGLSYLQLGQTLRTLSGGEAQRMKLAKDLIQSEGKRNLYLIDEPTTGLHPIDVEKFLVLLNKMVDAGNTVVVVEHNQQIIEASDWVIDLGPEGGIHGGEVIAEGTPLDVMRNPASVTGMYLFH